MVDAVCIASGPSLSPEHLEQVRRWHAAGRGQVIVVNTTFRAAPWADVLFALDTAWWDRHIAEVRAVFSGRRVGRFIAAEKYGVERAEKILPGWCSFGNSGASAVALAMVAGARQIALLGCDGRYIGGRRHWHGDHPKGLGNAHSVMRWPYQYRQLAKAAKAAGVSIVNCSPGTALDAFACAPLESCLGVDEA